MFDHVLGIFTFLLISNPQVIIGPINYLLSVLKLYSSHFLSLNFRSSLFLKILFSFNHLQQQLPVLPVLRQPKLQAQVAP